MAKAHTNMGKGTMAHKQRGPGRPVVRETLREVRERRALSLSDLAALAQVDRSTIHRIEQNQTSPYPKTRRMLAEALKIDVAAIAWPEAMAKGA